MHTIHYCSEHHLRWARLAPACEPAVSTRPRPTGDPYRPSKALGAPSTLPT